MACWILVIKTGNVDPTSYQEWDVLEVRGSSNFTSREREKFYIFGISDMDREDALYLEDKDFVVEDTVVQMPVYEYKEVSAAEITDVRMWTGIYNVELSNARKAAEAYDKSRRDLDPSYEAPERAVFQVGTKPVVFTTEPLRNIRRYRVNDKVLSAGQLQELAEQRIVGVTSSDLSTLIIDKAA